VGKTRCAIDRAQVPVSVGGPRDEDEDCKAILWVRLAAELTEGRCPCWLVDHAMRMENVQGDLVGKTRRSPFRHGSQAGDDEPTFLDSPFLVCREDRS
jgi:hypothetical protein